MPPGGTSLHVYDTQQNLEGVDKMLKKMFHVEHNQAPPPRATEFGKSGRDADLGVLHV